MTSMTQQYLQMRPMRAFRWPEASWDEDYQWELLESTVNHPLSRKYPPSQSYCAKFLKAVIERVEQHGMACHDHLMDMYMDVLPNTKSLMPTAETCYRSYQLPTEQKQWITLKEETVEIRSGTTGLRTWQAAFGLAKYLCMYPLLIKGKAVLELGAGAGFGGLSAARIGAKSVHFTDSSNEEVLSRLKENVIINTGKEQHEDIAPHQVSCLDWESVDDQELDKLSKAVDIIIASDIIFDPLPFPSLARIFSKILAHPSHQAVISVSVRSPETYSLFLESLSSVGISCDAHPMPHEVSSRFFFEEEASTVILHVRRI
ncbi:putative methyltransferase-domain-containing protein [Chytridium lagenaria]|nr:putative methyltransferase-domain-containing protein [Chytridium lagenaria]